MTAADRETVLGIITDTGMFTAEEEAVARELIDIYLQQPGQRDYLITVIEDDAGRVVGYMTYGPAPLSVGTYDLYWMAVAPATQGRGYGKKLMRWLEGKAQQLQGRMILIETSSTPHYLPTRQFYLGMGYKEVARIPDYYKPGDDRIIFAKHYPFKE